MQPPALAQLPSPSGSYSYTFSLLVLPAFSSSSTAGTSASGLLKNSRPLFER